MGIGDSGGRGNDSFFAALQREIARPNNDREIPVGNNVQSGSPNRPNGGNRTPVGNNPNSDVPDSDSGINWPTERVIPVSKPTEEIWKPELPSKMPDAKVDIVAQPISLTAQQKNNICIIAYHLAINDRAIEPPVIYDLWPVPENTTDKYKLQRAGKRPSITGIQQFLASEHFAERMSERGVDVSPLEMQRLMPEQIALISILADTTSQLGLRARLKKAGVTWAVYNGWRRQKPFADALTKATGSALSDSIAHADVQLAQMAQNGDLAAIKYLNEMVGRGPNDRKAIDAIQFARIVLEAVQKNVSPDQARAISAEIELVSRQLGIGA
jgi:hypothetical protein